MTPASCVPAFDHIPTKGVMPLAIALERIDETTFSPPDAIRWRFTKDADLVFNGLLIAIDKVGGWFIPVDNTVPRHASQSGTITFVLGRRVRLKVPRLH